MNLNTILIFNTFENLRIKLFFNLLNFFFQNGKYKRNSKNAGNSEEKT